MNPNLFYRNHLSQETTAIRPAPDSSRGSLSSAGARSLSAPSAHPTGGGLGDGPGSAAANDPLLRKYMPAGQRVRNPSTAVDEVTGLVGVNDDLGSGGIWEALADTSVQGGNGAPAVRRMRARGSQALQSAQAAAQDEALAAKMRWDPAAEQRRQEQRAREVAAWETSRTATSSNFPGGGGNGLADDHTSPARRGRKPVAHTSPSLSLGWTDAAPHNPPSAQPSTTHRAPAPWLGDENDGNAAPRPGRRAVEGKDSQRSRVTWQGYGKSDPLAAMAEPLGMANERDTDVFAIGNSRAEKFSLRSGRVRKPAQNGGGGASTIDLGDNAHADYASKFKPQVAQVPNHNVGKAAFFDAQNYGMAAPLEAEPWAPSGQPRKPVEFVGTRDNLTGQPQQGAHLPQGSQQQQQLPFGMPNSSGRGPEGSQPMREASLPLWHHAAPAPTQQQSSFLSSSSSSPRSSQPQVSQRRHMPSPGGGGGGRSGGSGGPPISPSPWATNYEASNAAVGYQAAAAAQPLPPRPTHYPSLVAPFDANDGLAAPANIHFHTLDTTHAHPAAHGNHLQHMDHGSQQPQQPSSFPSQQQQHAYGPTLGFESNAGPKVGIDPVAVEARAQEAASRYGPQGYGKEAPGFGHTRMPNQPQPLPPTQMAPPPTSPSQPHHQAPLPQSQAPLPFQQQQSQHLEPPPSSSQQQPSMNDANNRGGPEQVEAASFSNMDEDDKAAAVSFLEWYQGAYGGSDPPPALLLRAVDDDRRTRRQLKAPPAPPGLMQPPPPQQQQQPPQQWTEADVAAEAERRLGGGKNGPTGSHRGVTIPVRDHSPIQVRHNGYQPDPGNNRPGLW